MGLLFENDIALILQLGEIFFPGLYESLTCIQSTLSDGIGVYLNTLSQMGIPEILHQELHIFTDGSKSDSTVGYAAIIVNKFGIIQKLRT